MTGAELVETVEKAGGRLTVRPDGFLDCKVPEEIAAELLREIRRHRDAVIQVLKARAERIDRWLTACCAVEPGAWTDTRILRREFLAWSKMKESECSQETFIHELQTHSFRFDRDGWVEGLILLEDWLAIHKEGLDKWFATHQREAKSSPKKDLIQ